MKRILPTSQKESLEPIFCIAQVVAGVVVGPVHRVGAAFRLFLRWLAAGATFHHDGHPGADCRIRVCGVYRFDGRAATLSALDFSFSTATVAGNGFHLAGLRCP